MDCTVLKSKSIPPSKALEKIEKFIARNQANQMTAIQQQQALQEFQMAGGDDDAAATTGFVQHKVNYISPDTFYQLELIRDAMRREQQQHQQKTKEESEDED